MMQASPSPTLAPAAADIRDGAIHASVEIAAPPERVFAALTSDMVTRWWVRPGVFDTRTWEGDVRPGGKWRTTGVGGAGPYVLSGEYLEIDAPRRLVHSWEMSGVPAPASTVIYELTAIPGGTRLVLRHEGLPPQGQQTARPGWADSFAALAALLG